MTTTAPNGNASISGRCPSPIKAHNMGAAKQGKSPLLTTAKDIFAQDPISRIFNACPSTTIRVSTRKVFFVFIWLLLGTAALASPAILVLIRKESDASFSLDKGTLGNSVYKYSLLLTIMWMTFWGSEMVFNALPVLAHIIYDLIFMRLYNAFYLRNLKRRSVRARRRPSGGEAYLEGGGTQTELASMDGGGDEALDSVSPLTDDAITMSTAPTPTSPRGAHLSTPPAAAADDYLPFGALFSNPKKMGMSPKTWTRIKLFIALSPYIRNALTCFSLVYCIQTIHGNLRILSDDPRKWLSRTFYWVSICKFIWYVSVAILAQKVMMQRLSVYFHTRNYKKRIEENNESIKTLQHVMHRVRQWRHLEHQRKLRIGVVASGVQSPPLTSIACPAGANEQHHHHLQAANTITKHGELNRVTDIGEMIFDTLLGAANTCHSRKHSQPGHRRGLGSNASLSPSIVVMNHLAVPPSGGASSTAPPHLVSQFVPHGFPRDFLVESDFYPFCRDRTAAQRLVSILDADDNGDLSRSELSNGVQRIYAERDQLDCTLASSSVYLEKINEITSGLACFFALLYLIAIVETEIWKKLAGIGSALIGYRAIFQDTVASLISSILFVIFNHPYDLGDLVTIDPAADVQPYIVHAIELWNTALMSPKGLSYVPNFIMSDQVIGNLKRSEWQQEYVNLRLSYPRSEVSSFNLRRALSKLQGHVVTFCAEHPRHYRPLPDPSLRNIVYESNTTFSCQFVIPFKSSFYDQKTYFERKGMLIEAVRVGIKVSGLEYAERPPWEFVKLLESQASPSILH